MYQKKIGMHYFSNFTIHKSMFKDNPVLVMCVSRRAKKLSAVKYNYKSISLYPLILRNLNIQRKSLGHLVPIIKGNNYTSKGLKSDFYESDDNVNPKQLLV